MLKYKILNGGNQRALNIIVESYIDVGYRPQGGVCHSPETMQSNESWSQAMVKETKDE